jgi:hypothetical protein
MIPNPENPNAVMNAISGTTVTPQCGRRPKATATATGARA